MRLLKTTGLTDMAADPNVFTQFAQPVRTASSYLSDLNANDAQRLGLILQQNQVDNLPLQQQLLRLQLSGANLNNQTLQQRLDLAHAIITGGAPTADQSGPMALAQGATAGSVGPTTGNATRMNALQAAASSPAPGAGAIPGMPGLTFSAVTGMKLLGGPDLSTDYKTALEGVSHAPGSEVTDISGNRRTVPTLAQGQYIDGTGTVQNLPGYVSAASGAAGAVTNAQKAAENANTLIPLDRIDPTTGRPYVGTVGSLVSSVAPPPAAPQPPTGNAVPGSIAPTGPTFQQSSPQSRAAILTDMAKTGADPAQMTVNGNPIAAPAASPAPDIQSQLDAAKQAGPEGIARFQAQILPRLLAMPDPAQRAKALAGFNADLQTPIGTPVRALDRQQATAAPATPDAAAPAAPAAAPVAFAGPAELAASKITAENAAKLASQPPVTSAEALATNDQASFQKYNDGLNKSVTEGLFLQQRNAEIRANLAQFQAGIAGGHLRTDIATNLANLFPGNSTIQAAANTIAGGGPNAIAAATTFNNLIAGATVTNANQVLDNNGHISRPIITMLKEGAESAKSDPAALSRIMDVQDALVNQQVAEQKWIADQRKAGTFNAATVQSDWAQEQKRLMQDPSSVFSPASLRPATKIQPGGPAPVGTGGFTYIGPVNAKPPGYAAGGPVYGWGGPRFAVGNPIQAAAQAPVGQVPGQVMQASWPTGGAPTGMQVGSNSPISHPVGSIVAPNSTQAPDRQRMGFGPPVIGQGGFTGYTGAPGPTPGPSDNSWMDSGGGYGYADGGRVEPVIGSRSPLPTGGGGGLSKNAIQMLVTALAQPPQPTNIGVGQLVANPLTNPKAILDQQEKDAGYSMGGDVCNRVNGGPAIGPGGPKTDSIPARLSNGEHVMDAATVNAIGDGNNALGQQRLNAFRKKVKAK